MLDLARNRPVRVAIAGAATVARAAARWTRRLLRLPDLSAPRGPRAALPMSALQRITDFGEECRHVRLVPQVGRGAARENPAKTSLQALAVNKSHRPGSPLSSCTPRSSNFNPAPVTRSVTTRDSITSSAPDFAITRAAAWTAIPPISLPLTSISHVVATLYGVRRPRGIAAGHASKME
jgi:hypothetical protein